MANICCIRMDIFGDELDVIIQQIKDGVSETSWGAWLSFGADYNEAIGLDYKLGDHVVFEQDHIGITGEVSGKPPLEMVLRLSREYPRLRFQLDACDLTNSVFCSWSCQAGEFVLRERVKGDSSFGAELIATLDAGTDGSDGRPNGDGQGLTDEEVFQALSELV